MVVFRLKSLQYGLQRLDENLAASAPRKDTLQKDAIITTDPRHVQAHGYGLFCQSVISEIRYLMDDISDYAVSASDMS